MTRWAKSNWSANNDNNRRLRVIGNRVVRKIFGPKGDE